MDTKPLCKECGAPLSPETPEGLCPKCLMKAALPTEAGGQGAGGPGSTGNEPAALPDPANLAAWFPQLEILELLGQGGMGAVYKARQPGLDRLVALKILPTQAAGDPGFAERFTREARALARLNHPNIVAVYDFGQTHGLHYFVMEYVDGPNLRRLEESAKLSPREALQIIPQICEALQFAHDEGIVHRDIKPENVLLDKKGRVKIADFGLAKILGRETRNWRLTGARDVMGTPHYMAPEQVEHPQQVDHRADIYSLGVVFYEMLTGELPLGKFAPPSRKVELDVRLDEVVLHALEKEPDRRYQHASQVKTDVESIAGKPGLEPAPPAKLPPAPIRSETEPIPSAAPRREFWKIAVGTLAALLTVLILISVGATLLGLFLPYLAKEKARLRAHASLPNIVVAGKVVDSTTGRAISGARVADNFYGARPDRPPQESWTTPDGHYELKTWGEEHTLAASAPGYETKLAVLLTVGPGEGQKRQMDFALRPAGPVTPAPAEPAPGAAIEAVPAVVVRTVPESGSAGVDPSLTELRVTFSKPMMDKSWAWTIWGEDNFPEKTGEPRYLADGRTCVLPVKLQPGKIYATWLNSDYFQDFRDRAGHPAIPYLLIFETRN